MRNIFTIVAVIYLSIYFLCELILGWSYQPSETAVDIRMGDILFMLLYCCALTPLAALSSIWLVYVNQLWLSSIFFWATFQILFIVSMGMDSLPGLQLFFTSIQMLLSPLLLFVNFLYAHQKRNSLTLMGWGSIGIVWSFLLTWAVTGNLFEKSTALIGTASNELWWSQALVFGFTSMVVGGMVSFGIETFQILRKEYSSNG